MADRAIPNAGALKGWRKSSYSNDQGGSCLEVLDDHPEGVPVRDSKAPEGPAVVFPPGRLDVVRCSGQGRKLPGLMSPRRAGRSRESSPFCALSHRHAGYGTVSRAVRRAPAHQESWSSSFFA